MATIKKAQNGIAKYSDPKPLFEKIKKSKDSLDAAGLKLKVEKDLKNAGYLDQQRSLKAKFNEAAKNRNAKLPKQKNGGSVKAKDGKWMQKAAASIKKRGTKGVCTGAKFGGPTCKPGSKRYTLAKTFKSVAKKKK
jgi:hypothetical protein